MSAFRVGQRVRLVRATTSFGRGHVGREFIIHALGALWGTNRDTGERVRVEAYIVCDNGLHKQCVLLDQLEPLTPEGWQTVSWSDCAWSPEEVAA